MVPLNVQKDMTAALAKIANGANGMGQTVHYHMQLYGCRSAHAPLQISNTVQQI